jgi:1-aminocyclopropane-1-carboxylate deaminase/D-cysteine desulfhydrase-like pyridoxal-dependent ACC family enzyme
MARASGDIVTDADALTRIIRGAFSPRCLGRWPTPLERADSLGAAVGLDALWLKREDRSAPAYGGNKVRGLEFLLAEAPPDAVCLTVGGTGSTHCLATAVHARAAGLRSALAQFPQPESEWARATAAALAGYADVVCRARSRAAFPAAVMRAWLAARRLGRCWWIAGGGASAWGVAGQMLGALELREQLREPPDAVLVPLGSGGTAAGLLLGFAALGWSTRVIGVRVAPRAAANQLRVAALAWAARRLLRARGITVPAPRHSVRVVHGLGRGYGHSTAAGESARGVGAEHGVVLDSTYGGKAFAAAAGLAALGYRRVVFWHTFAAPVVSPPRPARERSMPETVA